MSIQAAVKVLLGTMLLGSLGCAPSSRNPASQHSQRNSELDRLEQQPGMPETYGTRGLEQARAFQAARNRGAMPLVEVQLPLPPSDPHP